MKSATGADFGRILSRLSTIDEAAATLDAAGHDRSITVTVLLRVRNVDPNASSTNFDILVAFHTFNVQFSSR